MNNEKENVSTETSMVMFWYYISEGIKNPLSYGAIVIYSVIFLKLYKSGTQYPLLPEIYATVLPLFYVIGLFPIIYFCGRPLSASHIHNALFQAGIRNHAGEAPCLIKRQSHHEKATRIVTLKLYSPGITVAMLQDGQARVEAALNAYIVGVRADRHINVVLLDIVRASEVLSANEKWYPEFLSDEPFEIALGRGLAGVKYVNLAVTPHILIGGSTGSGKSILLKCLLMQCIMKKANVYIADFKGGVDFGDGWDDCCTMCYDLDALKNILSALQNELQHRRNILRENGCPNIDAYNSLTGEHLPRCIFACDEVAELLDKTGRSKEEKAEIDGIISDLSTIARLGRAFGIHLLLATQRPDATIIPGQVKNNCDIRICGRADQVLSQIILDSSDAKERIPKNLCGRFLAQDGEMFQGFYSDFDCLISAK